MLTDILRNQGQFVGRVVVVSVVFGAVASVLLLQARPGSLFSALASESELPQRQQVHHQASSSSAESTAAPGSTAAAQNAAPPSLSRADFERAANDADNALTTDDTARTRPHTGVPSPTPEAADDGQEEEGASPPSILPYPQSVRCGLGTVAVQPATTFDWRSVQASEVLQAAFVRYTGLIFHHADNGSVPANMEPTALTGVWIDVTDVHAPLQLGVNESYVLRVPSKGGPATIQAATVWGALHAIETLSQIIAFNFDANFYKVSHVPLLIQDFPRFSHRELLLDTSRHYFPVPVIKSLIASFPYSKINVLHWHLVDSVSFPLSLPRRPLLAQKGAYNGRERYSPADVTSIVEFARVRGVRVVPEIDMPGHGASWCKGYPEICPSPTCRQPLNPAIDATYDVVRDVLLDITGGSERRGLFPDDMVHLGGDEVAFEFKCWKETAQISSWMKKNNYSAEDAVVHFERRAHGMAKDMGRRVVVWSDSFWREGKDSSVIVQFWKACGSMMQSAIKDGHKVLCSAEAKWYLDNFEEYRSWINAYNFEPCQDLSAKDCASLLGGGPALWTVYVDAGNLFTSTYPRLAAAAERLWSDRKVRDLGHRLHEWSCRVQWRGVGSSPPARMKTHATPESAGACG